MSRGLDPFTLLSETTENRPDIYPTELYEFVGQTMDQDDACMGGTSGTMIMGGTRYVIIMGGTSGTIIMGGTSNTIIRLSRGGRCPELGEDGLTC